MNGTNLHIPPNSANTSQRRAHTLSQVELNNMIVEKIKEKRQNPFWAPQKNADLFKVKDIIKDEKQLQRKRRELSEVLNKSNINTYTHKKQLMEGLNATHATSKSKGSGEGFYITERKYDPSATARVLNGFTDAKFKSDEKEKQKEIEKNKMIKEKINVLCAKNEHSAKNFINKTREIILMKYSNKVKQERVVRLCETFENEVEQYRDKIFTLEQSKDLFKDDFFNKYEVYVKNLRDLRDKEKNKINKLMDIKHENDTKIRHLENAINKNKEKIEQFSEYKKFMMHMKEHKMSISANLINLSASITNDVNLQGSLHKSFQNIAKAKKSIFKVKEKQNEKPTVKNEDPVMQEKDIRASLLTSLDGPIFENTSDFMEEFKKLEQENLNCLTKLNSAYKNLNQAKLDFEKYSKNESDEINHILKEIEKKQSEYKRIKARNVTLLAELQFLNRENIVNTGENKNIDPELISKQENAAKLLDRITNLYFICYKQYQKVLKDSSDEYVVMYNTITKTNSTDLSQHQVIDILRFIEKIFMILNNKYKEFKLNNKESKLISLEKNLETKRKTNFALAQKNVVIDKIKILEEVLKKKAERIILPIKKVKTRLRPIQKHKKTQSMSSKQKTENLDEYFQELN